MGLRAVGEIPEARRDTHRARLARRELAVRIPAVVHRDGDREAVRGSIGHGVHHHLEAVAAQRAVRAVDGRGLHGEAGVNVAVRRRGRLDQRVEVRHTGAQGQGQHVGPVTGHTGDVAAHRGPQHPARRRRHHHLGQGVALRGRVGADQHLRLGVFLDAAVRRLNRQANIRNTYGLGRFLQKRDLVGRIRHTEDEFRSLNHPLGGQQVDDVAEAVGILRGAATLRAASRSGFQDVPGIIAQRQSLIDQQAGADLQFADLEDRAGIRALGRDQVLEDQAAVGRAVAVVVEAENEAIAFNQNPRLGRVETQNQGLARHIIRNNRLACSGPIQDDSALRLPDGLLGLTGDEFLIDAFVTAGLDLIVLTLQIVGHAYLPSKPVA